MDNIIWEKIEDGEEMKALAQQYLDDPEGYDMLSKDQPLQEKNSFS